MFKAIVDFFKFYFVTPKPAPKVQEPAPAPVAAVKPKPAPVKGRPKTVKKPNGTTKSKTKK